MTLEVDFKSFTLYNVHCELETTPRIMTSNNNTAIQPQTPGGRRLWFRRRCRRGTRALCLVYASCSWHRRCFPLSRMRPWWRRRRLVRRRRFYPGGESGECADDDVVSSTTGNWDQETACCMWALLWTVAEGWCGERRVKIAEGRLTGYYMTYYL